MKHDSTTQTENAQISGYEPITPPAQWHERYSEDNQSDTLRVIDWLNSHQKNQAWLAKVARVNAATLNQVIAGKYGAPPTRHLAKLLDAISRQDARRDIGQVPFVETSMYQLVNSVCQRASAYRNVGLVHGYVGTGKTTCLKEYARRHPSTVLIESHPQMSTGTLLQVLSNALEVVPARQTNDARFLALVDALRGTDTLLAVDEAENLQPAALDDLRRIRDLAGIGVVLVGTEELNNLIKPAHGRFNRVRSRITFWPPIVKGITRDDHDALCLAALDQLGESDQAVLDRLWDYSQGSARLLVEGLLPALRDYGLRQGHSLSVGLLDQIAQKVLNISVARRPTTKGTIV